MTHSTWKVPRDNLCCDLVLYKWNWLNFKFSIWWHQLMSCSLHNEKSCLTLLQWGFCLLTTPQPWASTGRVAVCSPHYAKERKVSGFPGGCTLHHELLREAVPQLLLCLDRVRLVEDSGKDEVLFGSCLVQDLQVLLHVYLAGMWMHHKFPSRMKRASLSYGNSSVLSSKRKCSLRNLLFGKQPIRSARVRDRWEESATWSSQCLSTLRVIDKTIHLQLHLKVLSSLQM